MPRHGIVDSHDQELRMTQTQPQTDPVGSLPAYPFSYRGDALAPELARFVRHAPVTRVRTLAGDPGWLVTGHALARQALMDDRLSRGRVSDPSAPREDEYPPPPTVVATMAMLRTAGLRDEAVKGMSPRQEDVSLPRVRRIADDLLAGMVRRGGHGDLVEDFALPWAARVTCELLGLPEDAADELSGWFLLFSIGPLAAARLPVFWPETEECFAGWMRRLRPSGLLSRLVRLNERSATPLSDDDMVGIGHMLTFSGLGNPAAFVATCGLALAGDPHLAGRLREDPGMMTPTVEELYRWAPMLGDSIARVATEDMTLGETLVRAGELVLVSTDAANHDPAAFADPERMDPDRSATAPHLRFGQGRHYCPAATLNRLQTEVALSALLTAMPGLRLTADPASVEWREHHAVLMPVAVPVRW